MMNIILLSFICIITILCLADLLLNGIVGTWKTENQAGSLLHFPGSVNPHRVFKYAHKSSNNSAFIVNITNVRRGTMCEAGKG